MLSAIGQSFKSAEPFTKALIVIILVLVAYSATVQALACVYGLDETPSKVGNAPYKTYFSLANINWWGYPAFFPLVGLLVYLSTVPFRRAWLALVDEGVIRTVDPDTANPAKSLKEDLPSVLRRVEQGCLIAAVIVGLGLVGLEVGTAGKGVWAKDLTIHKQLTRACDDPDYWEMELFGATQPPCDCEEDADSGELDCTPNPRWSDPKIEEPELAWLYLMLRLQMAFIACLGALVLAQTVGHILLFAFFERTRCAARITLDWKSPLYEFGLHHWNQVLNNLYWGLSLGLLVPIMSRFSQRGAELDSGQLIQSIAVSLLVVGPIAGTMIVRQRRLPDTWVDLARELKKLDGEARETALETYHAQRLWPFDRNLASKLGIVVALALLSYIALVDLKTIGS